MARKFVIFYNDDLEPTIVLDDVLYHKHILPPDGTIGRAGGGRWFINKNGVLQLDDLSGDFGKYSFEMAQEAFDKKNVTFAGEATFDELKIKSLEMK